MKLFAHRGWSEGPIENTISAFKKSVELGLDGVEFDIRYGADKKTIVCSHDKASDSSLLTFDEALQFLSSTNLELLIEVKESSGDFYTQTMDALHRYNLASRTTIFAFPEEATRLPWGNKRDIKLGIIAPYPQDIRKFVEMYKPDMVLLGWGTKKERMQFRIAWTFLSLKKVFKKYSEIKFVIGVAFTEKDKKWLSKQTGIYGITADLPLK